MEIEEEESAEMNIKDSNMFEEEGYNLKGDDASNTGNHDSK